MWRSSLPTASIVFVASAVALLVVASQGGVDARPAHQAAEPGARLRGVPSLRTRSEVKQVLGAADERVELHDPPRAVEQWLYRRPNGRTWAVVFTSAGTVWNVLDCDVLDVCRPLRFAAPAGR